MLPSRRIAVLAYHSIDNSHSILSTSPKIFRDQMQALAELGIRVIRLEDIKCMLGTDDPTEPVVAITFDDGFRSVYECGLPILQRYGFPATVFLVTDYCGRDNSWPSQPPGIMRQPLLSWKEIKEMSHAGIAFGSHTRTHPDLTMISCHDAANELVTSKKMIEDAVGYPVNTVAYPYGAYNKKIKHLAEEHFSLACSTQLGYVQPRSDLFALERLDMYYLRHPVLFRRPFAWDLAAYVGCRRTARNMKRRMSYRVSKV
jgi:peptidoglycan/xylan/chitin deacetylase (PgdA/CDA1 family)